MKKKLKLAFDQLEMDMDLLPDTELGRYNGGTGSAYGPGDGAAFYNWYVNGGYEYGGSAVWFFTNGGYSSSSGSESGSIDNDTEYWIWAGNSWVWMGCGAPDENAPHYGDQLPEVVITVNGNNQSFQNPYTVWYDWLIEIGGWSGGSSSGSGSNSGSGYENNGRGYHWGSADEYLYTNQYGQTFVVYQGQYISYGQMDTAVATASYGTTWDDTRTAISTMTDWNGAVLSIASVLKSSPQILTKLSTGAGIAGIIVSAPDTYNSVQNIMEGSGDNDDYEQVATQILTAVAVGLGCFPLTAPVGAALGGVTLLFDFVYDNY